MFQFIFRTIFNSKNDNARKKNPYMALRRVIENMIVKIENTILYMYKYNNFELIIKNDFITMF